MKKIFYILILIPFLLSQAIEDLLYKYDMHEARVQALKELRGEAIPKIDQGLEELDNIILNEYLDGEGDLRTNEILQNSQNIIERAGVDEAM